ncbi:Ig-like domain-containing protein [Morganella morganii]|uniref:Ig-like domain-containing protein n=1 Tax=Morganella morganii TaxID=582 RepID=UPI000D85EA46|nr:Ig-like domain-containing protein [Morganella morganii]EHZ6678767.1 Ig-like domain-containing protein [Morganella morganii]EKU8061830.1 Ig-like domain-containing protein [Morganella morganii]ELA7732418.1 Ig-like domain-containing protein [Morganella morganii]ELA7777729.1 Ig-like domain-containing protein [Morganella morganii]ELB1287845.1 Ig-like domain-containing protein [Morganella morganii]
MAQCPDDKGLVMGNAGILRIAPGCPGTVPDQSAFLRLGALTSKSVDYGTETVTSKADDTKGLTEAIVTGMDVTIKFDGEIKRKGANGSTSAFDEAKYIVDEVKAGRQPSRWVQLDMKGDGSDVIQCYMNFSSWSMEFPTKEISTYSGELKIADADSFEWLQEEVTVQSIVANPATLTAKAGETSTFTVGFNPVDATNKNYEVVSDKPNFATVSKLLNVVTVTGVAAGTANITVTSEDGSKTAKCVVTVTAA